jgi:hypothetical protein
MLPLQEERVPASLIKRLDKLSDLFRRKKKVQVVPAETELKKEEEIKENDNL